MLASARRSARALLGFGTAFTATSVVRWFSYISKSTMTVVQRIRMQPLAEPLTHPEREEIELARVLHALSDPVRLQIVAAIANGGECAMNAIEVPVTKSTCTHHFKVLREAGVLAQRHVGTARMN